MDSTKLIATVQSKNLKNIEEGENQWKTNIHQKTHAHEP